MRKAENKPFYHPLWERFVTIEELYKLGKLSSLFIERYNYKPDEWQPFATEKELAELRDDNQMNPPRTYGIEIELNQNDILNGYSDNNRNNNVALLLEYFNQKGYHAHVMYDGSLRNGYELVLAPMTYNYFMETFDPKEINKLFYDLGLYASYDCGLHIHAGYLSEERTTIRKLEKTQDSILELFAVTFPLWTSIADRAIGYQSSRYAHTKFFTKPGTRRKRYLEQAHKSLIENGMSLVELGKDDTLLSTYYQKDDRYQAINLNGTTTAEFRLFKGSSNWFIIQEYITFVDKFMGVVKDDVEITNIKDYVDYTKSEKHLKKVVRDLKRFNILYARDLIGLTLGDGLELKLYKRPTKHVRVGNFVIKKSDWDRYVENVGYYEKALKERPNDPYATEAYQKVNIDFGEFIIDKVHEVVGITDSSLSIVRVGRHDYKRRVLERSNLDDFVVLYGIPRDFFTAQNMCIDGKYLK